MCVTNRAKAAVFCSEQLRIDRICSLIRAHTSQNREENSKCVRHTKRAVSN